MTTTPVVHDHIVLLLNTEQFENPPKWLTTNFTIIEGGTHTGGSSRNKLIVFKDGTYLELFNWIKRPVEFLDWADKQPGLIDFAVTTLDPVTPEQNFETLTTNLGEIPDEFDLGVSYQQPKAGGRKRADGTEVKWKNSRPVFNTTQATPPEGWFPNGRIDVPFFCHDVTPRTVRVPFQNKEITTHACGATGIFNVECIVPTPHFDAYKSLYKAVFGVDAPRDIAVTRENRMRLGFQIGVPNPSDSFPVYVSMLQADYPEDGEFLSKRGIGIHALVLRTDADVTGTDDYRVEWFDQDKDSVGSTVGILRPNAFGSVDKD